MRLPLPVLLPVALLGLPLLGVGLAGLPLDRYLEFPPRTRYVPHAPFSPFAFAVGCLLVAGLLLPFFLRAAGDRGPPGTAGARSAKGRGSFPGWGWLGPAVTVAAWILAWGRFPWFARFQAHTFTPLWVGYILTVNALARGRTGRCLMLDRTRAFLLLFPLSAVFWWFFEYLNRFVQNWYYTGVVEFGPWEYFLHATLPFSTVLPAVLSTRDLLLSFPALGKFGAFLPLKLSRPRAAALGALAAAAAGLAGIGVWPDLLFPLVWVAPLLVIVPLRVLRGRPHPLQAVSRGDWRPVVASALAALLCGLFWEMWNWQSYARWIYAIPYVGAFRIFEMPVLGYAGYLPFGLICAAAGEWAGLADEKADI
jgi:hypothetical protein